MNCKEAQFLMALFIANDPDLSERQHIDFQKHLENCPKCDKEYQESKFVIELVKQYWPISEDTLELSEKADKSYTPKMTVEEGWQDLLRRCPDLAEAVKRGKRLQLIWRISAVAACLVVGILGWLMFSVYSKPKTVVESVQVASAPTPTVKIELLSNNTKTLISSGQQIISADGLKTLLINGKHRMVLNTGTSLSIEPLMVNSNIGCLVKLNSGEIYTHVEHDGNPFIVQTANGKAIITGTTFNVRAEGNNTTLIVSEGNVQLTSEEGKVSVGAGQLSQIVNQSAPTKPAECDVGRLTAWATGQKIRQQLADKDYEYFAKLGLPFSEPVNLESVDYEQWVKENREWFKQEFPWIFQLKNALAEEGIEVDYPELLIKTGDIWQFNYPANSPIQIPILNKQSLLKTALIYGFDEQWLNKAVPSTKNCENYKGQLAGLEAFEKLNEQIQDAQNNPAKLDSLPVLYLIHAGKYLANTRTLIWFGIKNGFLRLDNLDKDKVLSLLQQEVVFADKLMQTTVLQVINISEQPLCGTKIISLNKQETYLADISQIEKEFLEYAESK